MSILEKSCSRCKEVKSTSLFSLNPKHSTGFNSQCKACIAEAQRMRYHADPEAARRRQRKYHAQNPEIVSDIRMRKKEREDHRRRAFVSCLLQLQQFGYTEVEGKTIEEWLEELK